MRILFLELTLEGTRLVLYRSTIRADMPTVCALTKTFVAAGNHRPSLLPTTLIPFRLSFTVVL